MQAWIIQLSTSHAYLVYGIIILLACAEGPILSLLFGLLLRLGYFDFPLVYGSLMIGDLIGDVIWYYIGYYFGHRFIARFGKYFNITEESVDKVKNIFHRHKHKILFLSKITNGLGFALVTLITAGMVRIPFLMYMLTNITGQFVWTGLLLAVGFFFGNLYVTINNWAMRGVITIFLGLVIWAFINYKKYLKIQANKLGS